MIFTRFWGFHYFDWITYLRRAGLYAGVGGLALGTVLFGSPELSVRRVQSFYRTWFCSTPRETRGEHTSLMIGKF